MARSHSFHAGRKPFPEALAVQLPPRFVSGPIPFCNPTRADYRLSDRIRAEKPPTPTVTEPTTVVPEIDRLWRTRDNRKGRHALRVSWRPPGPEGKRYPRNTAHPIPIAKGIIRMLTMFPYWDVSFLVAWLFTLGSVIWVINAFFVWLPLAAPRTEFPHEILTGGGITAFVGATVFEVGSVLLVLEAINENQTGCFGWAVETVSKKAEDRIEQAVVRVKSDFQTCRHHHVRRHAILKPSETISDHPHGTSPKSFRWFPSRAELRTHYVREIGFQASFVQLIGATIFWISGFTGLPGIQDHLSQAVTNGVYWVPQIVGGACFVISGLLFTIETQPKWYVPAPRVLGWHTGLWNFIGGIGFTLCGVLGPASANSGVAYQSTLATFWGSWAFLLGSGIQWYESLDKYPVVEKKKKKK
ncbi:uncharacterized protein ACLA_017360 [Aspergillus clavatus NRRL 1]|uniref:Integral membrane protein n=1 Tax=Aspergillus clavatus (strain ATCC 1007 / CBS 513.65 / DSM 816 / NCTC 3887 / NRRL 1 / QM 1276 / 107) TaxID=344612 RepID=A1CC21_ASPCL|nr:uncharacterized protein ACLA_017360 [Aspergillus clavatus NRRL 1]EAW13289.1 conserved hypothetical protein [Aspergillus clavatus NRRL 1]